MLSSDRPIYRPADIIDRYLRFLRVSADFFSGIGRFIYLLNFFGHDLQLHRYIDVID